MACRNFLAHSFKLPVSMALKPCFPSSCGSFEPVSVRPLPFAAPFTEFPSLPLPFVAPDVVPQNASKSTEKSRFLFKEQCPRPLIGVWIMNNDLYARKMPDFGAISQTRLISSRQWDLWLTHWAKPKPLWLRGSLFVFYRNVFYGYGWLRVTVTVTVTIGFVFCANLKMVRLQASGFRLQASGMGLFYI